MKPIKQFAAFLILFALCFLCCACQSEPTAPVAEEAAQSEDVSSEATEETTAEETDTPAAEYAQPGMTLQEVYAMGYENVCSTQQGSAWVGEFLYNNTSYAFLCTMTEDQQAALADISWDDEDADAKKQAVMDELVVSSIEDLSAYRLSDEALQDYVGQPASVLPENGFSCIGYARSDDALTMYYELDGAEYNMVIRDISALPDYDADSDYESAVADMPIAALHYQSFSWGLSRFLPEDDDWEEESESEPVFTAFDFGTGEPVESMEALNEKAGVRICRIHDEAAEESFCILENGTAQYCFTLDGYPCCIRALADTTIDLRDFSEDSMLLDENGYASTLYYQDECITSYRFLYEGVQYDLILNDCGAMDMTLSYEAMTNFLEWITLADLPEPLRSMESVLVTDDETTSFMWTASAHDTLQVTMVELFPDDSREIRTLICTINGSRLEYENGLHYAYDAAGERTDCDPVSGYFELTEDGILWSGAGDEAHSSDLFR